MITIWIEDTVLRSWRDIGSTLKVYGEGNGVARAMESEAQGIYKRRTWRKLHGEA